MIVALITFTHCEGITPQYRAKYKLIICKTDTEEMRKAKKRLIFLRTWIFTPTNWLMLKNQVRTEIKTLEEYILTHMDTQIQEQTEKLE